MRRHHNLQDVRTGRLRCSCSTTRDLVDHSRDTATALDNLTGQCHITDYAQRGKMTRPDTPHAIEDIIYLLLAIDP
jgi:hypothetical protein